MGKVLISFMGTGPKDNERQYRKTTYKFPDGATYTNSFVAAAIKEYKNIDKLILVGTVKSMWEEVYRTFTDNLDEDYYLNLADYCEKSTCKSELKLPDIEKIEKALGNGSKVILIKYGLNEDEIAYNQETILGLESCLNKNDELYVDITHSFRSLPLFLINTLVYLQNVSSKKIKICDVFYGMSDIYRELKYAPIVSLKKVIETNDWISGAYSLKEFGNAYKISNLLGDAYASAKTKLKRFSDAKNLNYFGALQSMVQEIQSIRGQNQLPTIAAMVVNPVIKEFITQMNVTDKPYLFQYMLAKWHFSRMNYSSSYICLTESIISYVCKLNDLDPNNKDARDGAKAILSTKHKELKSIYTRINKVRNQLAHNVNGVMSLNDMISNLESGLKEYDKIIDKNI